MRFSNSPNLVGDYVYDNLPGDARAHLRKSMEFASRSEDCDFYCAVNNAGTSIPLEAGKRATQADMREMCETMAVARLAIQTDEGDWRRILRGAFGERYRVLARELYEEASGLTDAAVFADERCEVIERLDRQRGELRVLGIGVPEAHAAPELVSRWGSRGGTQDKGRRSLSAARLFSAARHRRAIADLFEAGDREVA